LPQPETTINEQGNKPKPVADSTHFYRSIGGYPDG
jgi:hypothetical protein